MTLDKLIEIASRGYPDGLVEQAHTGGRGKVGDTLAEFIAIELAETFEPQMGDASQIEEAWEKMDTARREIESVMNALNEHGEQ